MNDNRLLQSAAVAVLSLQMLAAPGSARGDIPQRHPMQAPNLSLHGRQTTGSLDDAFAGLGLSEEQNSEVEKIRQNAEAQKAAIIRNQKLNQDQKEGMILGVIRVEYSQIFQALTPGQQQIVRERIRALQAAEAPRQKPNAPRN